MVVNEKSYVRSEWNEELQYYINTWYGYVEKEQFIEAVKVGLDFMLTNKVKYHLADTTYMDGAWDGDDWIVENFWKKLVEEGNLSHFGLIIPEQNLIGEISNDVMKDDMAQKGVFLKEYCVFRTKDEAEEWIKSLIEAE